MLITTHRHLCLILLERNKLERVSETDVVIIKHIIIIIIINDECKKIILFYSKLKSS